MRVLERRQGRTQVQVTLRRLGLALIIYGALGVAIHLRLLPLFVQGLVGWLGLPSSQSQPLSLPVVGLLQAHYDGLPSLPWLAWLVGTALILNQKSGIRNQESEAPDTRHPTPDTQSKIDWRVPALLVAILLVAGYARISQLWPESYGLAQYPYDDEGVYAGSSQLFLQGVMPYRDYFFAHPPVAAFSYAPAMAYHFTEWGSPTSFVLARYLSVAYSLLTLAILFFVGVRLAGVWGGAVAGALYAVDGRIVEINRKVMLDGPMVLLSCGALLLYLWARPALVEIRDQKSEIRDQKSEIRSQNETSQSEPATEKPTKRYAIRNKQYLLLALVGACAALSALTKIAGIACLVAILADIVWLALEGGRQGHGGVARRLLPQLGSILGGALLAGALVVGPFLVIAPSQIVRDVFFFQLLRPGDGTIEVPARIADLSATLGNALTPLLAALGFVILSFWVWARRELGAWRPVILWTFFSLLLFTYSRSFYGHYYIQLAAPLCLLGAGVSLLPRLGEAEKGNESQSVETGEPQVAPAVVRLSPVTLLALVALPLLAVQWGGILTRREDRIFEIVARYVNNAVPPGTPVLSTDEQFNFLAARPPSRNATGYLVDSYGHMISLGLGLEARSLGDLWGDALGGARSNDAYAIMQRAAPQADILDRASTAPLVVIHNKGFARLTDATLKEIEANMAVVEQEARYTIYRAK